MKFINQFFHLKLKDQFIQHLEINSHAIYQKKNSPDKS